MAEHPKLKTYTTMAVQGTATLTGSFDTWTAFLRTAGRLYKYSFLEQLMIHIQRPGATACAEYRLWSGKMRRYVRRGAKGIAIISQVNGAPVLRYVFDIADTGARAGSRTPWLWQYRDEHRAILSAAMEGCFQIPASKGLPFQIAAVAAQFTEKYWEVYQEKILQGIGGALLKKYSEADAGMAFQDAAAASVSYAVLSRCGLSPEQFFEAEDFSHVYEFSGYESVLTLGAAVSEVSAMLLRVLEHTIKQYERGKQSKQRDGGLPPASAAVSPVPEIPQPDITAQKGLDESTSGPALIPAPGQQETSLFDPAPAAPQPSPKPVSAANFRITDDHLGEGGPKAKFQMNIAAVETLRQIEAEGRWATPEEQEVLSRCVGWGCLPNVFDESKPDWNAEYRQLKSLLTEDEYASARASVLNAHYTSPIIIKAIYQAIAGMGFTSGNILEPSCGIGNFFGLLPESMSASRLYGVELDSITGRIAKQLYPKADIQVAGFETTERQGFYDLAVGNVPFGHYQVNDAAYSKLGFSVDWST